MTKDAPKFTKESDLCAAFLAAVAAPRRGSPAWTAYPETAGFDILLVRQSDGVQIGIEAKLRLNTKVVCQALPNWSWRRHGEGPDYRAVLVPWGGADIGLDAICAAIGVTVIRFHGGINYSGPFDPALPEERYGQYDRWHEWAPDRRCPLPGYVPDVTAGASAPVTLTMWKISAIKIAILLEERPVTRADFAALGLSPSRWLANPGAWLIKSGSGYVAGPQMPDFKAQHPRNYEEIRADKASWKPNTPPPETAKQGALL